MPRMNHIYLLGYLKTAPRIKPDKESGLPAGVLMYLTVVRPERSVGDRRTDIGRDDITVIVESPELAQKISGAAVGDVVWVEGVFQQRRDMKIPHICMECNQLNIETGSILCVHALYGGIANPLHDVQKALEYVISMRHVSNVAYVSGFLTNDPREYSSAKDHVLITQYPLIVNRQVTIPTDPPELRTDEIVVKSFSERARRDKDTLHRGSSVMVYGYLHARSDIIKRGPCRQEQMIRDASHINANDMPKKKDGTEAAGFGAAGLQTAGDTAGTAALFSRSIWKEDRKDTGRRYMDPNDPLFEFEDGDDLDDL